MMSTDSSQTNNDNEGGLFARLVGPATGKPVKQRKKLRSDEKDLRIRELSSTVKKVNALNLMIASKLKKEKQKSARLESELHMARDQLESFVDDTLAVEDIVDDTDDNDILTDLE